MIRIKANPKLFRSWKNLAVSIDSLKNVVQNDVDLNDTEVIWWCERAQSLYRSMTELTAQTAKYLTDGKVVK